MINPRFCGHEKYALHKLEHLVALAFVHLQLQRMRLNRDGRGRNSQLRLNDAGVRMRLTDRGLEHLTFPTQVLQ